MWWGLWTCLRGSSLPVLGVRRGSRGSSAFRGCCFAESSEASAPGNVASFLFQCYKSSKDHSPQLDVNLLGSSVVHKEKQVRKKEHKLKIMPMNADVIVLGLQSKDQAEQWLRVSDPLPPWCCPVH